MEISATGDAAPDDVWERYLTPATWPTWAPQIHDVRCDDPRLRAGSRGTVAGPAGVPVPFRVLTVDEERREWRWRVGPAVGPGVVLHHAVRPDRDGGTTATLAAQGPVGRWLPAYQPVARAALRGLVTEGLQRFAFRFAPTYRPAGFAVGVTPSTAWVTLDPRELRVRYGPWRLRTGRGNIAGAELVGDFAWHRTAGPARLSLTDRGISFTPNGDAAVCLRLHEPVPGIGLGLRHPGVTLGVARPEALLAALVD